MCTLLYQLYTDVRNSDDAIITHHNEGNAQVWVLGEAVGAGTLRTLEVGACRRARPLNQLSRPAQVDVCIAVAIAIVRISQRHRASRGFVREH